VLKVKNDCIIKRLLTGKSSLKHEETKSIHSASNRLCLGLDRLRIAEYVLRVIFRLDRLQLGKIATPVHLSGSVALELRIGVVHIQAPGTILERVGDTLAQTLDQIEPIGGVLLVLGHAVVELEKQECVSVDVGCVAGLGLGHGRVFASGDVHLEPP
jgi:hypothetical protein